MSDDVEDSWREERVHMSDDVEGGARRHRYLTIWLERCDQTRAKGPRREERVQ
jgi:hypothetical protein